MKIEYLQCLNECMHKLVSLSLKRYRVASLCASQSISYNIHLYETLQYIATEYVYSAVEYKIRYLICT